MKRYKILLLITFILLPHSSVLSQNLEKLVLEPGFKISIFAENLSSPRQMAEGQNGTIFIGERSGQIVALLIQIKMERQILKKLLLKI
jgi:glucose/arabinose dehydrogenase